MDFKAYVPVIVCAVVAFLILHFSPKFLEGKKYGDKHKMRPDPIMSSLIILLAGAVAVYLLYSGLIEGYQMGSRSYRMSY